MFDVFLVLLLVGAFVISHWKEKLWVAEMLKELDEAKILVKHVQELLADY